MSTSKSTPGPWIYDERAGCVAIYAGEETECLDQPPECFIAYKHGTHTGDGWEIDQQKCADFKRIVACVNGCEGVNPEAGKDLLAACKAARGPARMDNNAFEKLSAAIAKATGEEVPA